MVRCFVRANFRPNMSVQDSSATLASEQAVIQHSWALSRRFMAPLCFFTTTHHHHRPSWAPNFTARNCCTSKSISVCLLLFCHRLLLYNTIRRYSTLCVGRRIWYVCASQHARNPRLYNGALLASLALPHVPAARDSMPQNPRDLLSSPHAKLKNETAPT